MPTIVHFEIPSDNIERTKKFYNGLFGWNIERWSGSSEGMEYWLISTVDNKGDKALGGGMMKRQSPQQQGINYFDVNILHCRFKMVLYNSYFTCPMNHS